MPLIFLLGMMGAGKTSVGRELARTHALAFIDLDRRIELLFGRSIAAQFERGEAWFRACERAALRSLVDEPGFADASAVVATGGGVVTNPENLACMAVGVRVYLEVDVASLCSRLSSAPQRRARPLLDDDATLEPRLTALLSAREAAYRSADIVVDGRGSPAEIASQVWRQVRPAAH